MTPASLSFHADLLARRMETDTDIDTNTESDSNKDNIASGMSIKHRCQCHFIAKQLYMDNSLCQLIYKCSEHTNKNGDQCHGTMVAGFQNVLGGSLSVKRKDKINSMLDFGLTPSQIMAQYK